MGNLLRGFLCRDKRDYLAVNRFRQEHQAHPGSCNWRVTDNKALHERGSYASNLLLISEVIFKSLLVKREFLFQELSVPQGLQRWRNSSKANYVFSKVLVSLREKWKVFISWDTGERLQKGFRGWVWIGYCEAMLPCEGSEALTTLKDCSWGWSRPERHHNTRNGRIGDWDLLQLPEKASCLDLLALYLLSWHTVNKFAGHWLGSLLLCSVRHWMYSW